MLKYVDVLVITETKLDDTFLTSQLLVTGFSVPYSLHQNRNGGRIMIFIRDDIPSRVLMRHIFPDDIKGLFIELNFRKAKWLLFGTYHPKIQSDSYYFNNLNKALDLYSHYDKKLLVGDFNTELSDAWSIFSTNLTLKTLSKKKPASKIQIILAPSTFFLTSNSLAFQNTKTAFAGLSDCHKLVLRVLKTTFSENKQRLYQDYKKINFYKNKQPLYQDYKKINFYKNKQALYQDYKKINFYKNKQPLYQDYQRINFYKNKQPLCQDYKKINFSKNKQPLYQDYKKINFSKNKQPLYQDYKKINFSENKQSLYQDYKKINFYDFNDELKTIFSRNTVGSCYQFDQVFLNVLDKYSHHSSSTSKPLRKTIMTRFHLEKGYHKNKSGKRFKAYKKQEKLLKQTV